MKENSMAIQSTLDTRDIDRRETVSLIGSDKVEGTAVYRSNGDKVGSIQRVMIDKISGKVAYAVMSFGGFLGIGEDYYPLPWSLLTYNPKLEGYEVNIGEQQLKGAPKYAKNEAWDWGDRARGQKVYDYYGVTPYWGV
jgi:PRC-barrel domain protein